MYYKVRYLFGNKINVRYYRTSFRSLCEYLTKNCFTVFEYLSIIRCRTKPQGVEIVYI